MKELYIDFDGVILDTITEGYSRMEKLGLDTKNSEDCISFFGSLDWKEFIKNTPEINNSIDCIQKIIDRLFNYNNINIKFFKQQYDPEVKKREQKEMELRKKFNLFNKKNIEKSTKHLNDEMDEAAEEFYKTKKEKEKDDGLSL